MKWILSKIHSLEEHVDKPWYPYVLAIFGFAYHFLMIVPVDTAFVTSCFLVPRRWLAMVLTTSTGFALGGTSFAYLVMKYGNQIIEKVAPGIMHTAVWAHCENWIHHYGVLSLMFISIIPFTLHPLVALAGLEHLSPFTVFMSLWVGRVLKYLVVGGACVYLPHHIPLPESLTKKIRPQGQTQAK